MSDDLVSIYEAESFADAELIHQYLQDEGIDAWVDQTPSPLDGLNTAHQSPHIRVRESDARRAGEMIQSYLADRD